MKELWHIQSCAAKGNCKLPWLLPCFKIYLSGYSFPWLLDERLKSSVSVLGESLLLTHPFSSLGSICFTCDFRSSFFLKKVRASLLLLLSVQMLTPAFISSAVQTGSSCLIAHPFAEAPALGGPRVIMPNYFTEQCAYCPYLLILLKNSDFVFCQEL